MTWWLLFTLQWPILAELAQNTAWFGWSSSLKSFLPALQAEEPAGCDVAPVSVDEWANGWPRGSEFTHPVRVIPVLVAVPLSHLGVSHHPQLPDHPLREHTHTHRPGKANLYMFVGMVTGWWAWWQAVDTSPWRGTVTYRLLYTWISLPPIHWSSHLNTDEPRSNWSHTRLQTYIIMSQLTVAVPASWSSQDCYCTLRLLGTQSVTISFTVHSYQFMSQKNIVHLPTSMLYACPSKSTTIWVILLAV